jgi:hypothetical protein
MSEQQGLEATIRDALAQQQRNREGMTTGLDEIAAGVMALAAVDAVGAWLVRDEQVTRAARVQFDLDKRHAPNLTDLVWDALPEETKEPFLADARAVLGALVQGDTP